MSADEETRRTDEKPFTNRSIVFSWVATDMLQQHIRSFDGEVVHGWIVPTDIASINIAMNGTKRTEGSKFFCNLPTADISGMPYLIALLEMLQVAVVPIAMSVR
jgi:hypothetical protein